MVIDVNATQRVVEGEVLRIEGAIGDRGVIQQFAPMHAVRRTENAEALAVMRVGHRLEALVGGRGGIRVEEGREVVRADAFPDDVVFLRALELEEPGVQTLEVDAVPAFRHAAHLAGAPRADLAAVVHQHALSVLHHGEVGGGFPLPELVQLQRDLLRHRMLKTPLDHAASTVDQEVIDEQLAPRANFIRRFVSWLRRR